VPSGRPAYGLAWNAVTVVTSFQVTATREISAHNLYGSEEDENNILPHCVCVLKVAVPILMLMNE